MKKGLSMLIALVMLLTMVSVNVSAASFADTEGKNCETAVEVLAALGIVEGKAEGSYEPDSSLTRAEMATIILRAMNLAAGAKGSDVFTDVPSSHWAYANIATAYQMGIINGTSATTFAPDAVVTYEQAVKMVVAALGYGIQADAMGGYPSGYLAKAAQLDILKGVKTGGEMTRGDMAVLLYNSLDVELYLQKTFGPDAFAFDANASQTLLSYYLKVNLMTSAITATPMAQTVAPSRVLLSDEVAVGATILKKGTTNAQELLGVRSDIYTRTSDDSDIADIIAIIPRANTEILDLNSKDIEANSTNAQLIYLNEAGKEVKLSVAGATLVHNGRVKTSWTAADYQPASGTVRLIANDGANYDLIIVESFKNYVVDSVVIDDNEVYLMEPREDGSVSMIIDLSEVRTPTLFTDEAGMPLTLGDLARWDILSVAESADGAVRRIYRSYQMVSGTISEISDDEVVIGDTKYAVSEYMQNSERFGIALGQGGAYYLDFTGAIVAVDTTYEVVHTYGWIVGAELTKGIDQKANFKIFTQDGEFVVFGAMDKITYAEGANERTVDPTTLLGATENAIWDGNENVKPQLVRYKTNEEGLLIKLEAAANKTALGTPDDEKIGNEFSMDWYQNNNRRSRGFNGTPAGDDTGKSANDTHNEYDGQFFTKVFKTADTKVFIIPADKTIEEDYKMDSPSMITLENWRSGVGCVCFYDVTEEYEVPVLVVRNDLYGGESGADYPPYEVPAALVTGISVSMTENGDVAKTVKLVNQNGQELSVYAEEGFRCLYKAANADIASDPDWYAIVNNERVHNSTVWKNGTKRAELYMDIEKLQPGDIVQYQANSLGQLSLASVVHRFKYTGNVEITQSKGNMSTTSPDLKYRGGNLELTGTVIKKLKNGIFVSVNLANTLGEPNGETAVRALPSQGKFLLWDSKKQTYRAITAADVVQNDYIFSHWQTTTQKFVVVYR